MDFKSNICFLNKHNTKTNIFKRHSHNCYEMVYFFKGKGRTIIGDKSYYVAPNSYIIIPLDTEHIECLEGYGEILFIGFDFFSDVYKLDGGVYFADDNTLFLMLNKIFEEYKNQNLGFCTVSKSLLDLIIVNLLRGTLAEGKKCKNLNHIKNYIEQHSDQKINFKELAAISGYSEDYFRHIFKQKFAVSPQQYLINVRMGKARDMLLTTDYTCTEIAYECGFSNGAQMSAMFKRYWDISPKGVKITDLYKN